MNAAGGTIFDVDATNCSDKGFYVSGSAESPALACAIFDSCRAENNNYGFYFGAYTDSCKVRNRCQANDNTLEGIYCESSMKIGPKVLCEDNGQNGLKLVGVGSASIVEGVKAVGHDNAAGCLCYNASNPEIKNCCFDGNYDDLDSKLNSYPILGDIGNSKGQNNSLINATRYNVANYKSGWIMMAEGCYWGPVEGEQYPDVSIYGSVDIDPWLTSDPGFSWRLPMWAAPRSNRPSVNYPNPFNAETRIIYNVARNGSHVDIRIYDVKGRLIKVLVNESKPAGEFTVAWDGRGQDGGIQASGVYFASVAIGKQAPDTRKLVLLK